MLKLKKTNLIEKQKNRIQAQQQTELVQQKTSEQTLTELLENKPLNFNQIQKYFSQQTSISAVYFVKCLQAFTNQQNIESEDDLSNSLSCLRKLIKTPHDSTQVKKQLKKTKNIDPLLILATIWQIRQDIAIWNYVKYMISAFPTQIFLNGKIYIQKWQSYFLQYQNSIEINKKLKQELVENELKDKILKNIKQQNKLYGFVDTYINL